MIEIVFRGRLGNQLFQHAYAMTVARRHAARLSADFGWYFRAPESFDLWRFAKTGYRPITPASEITGRIKEKLRRLSSLKDYEMHEARFEPAALEVPDGTRLHGWFQSMRYFQENAADVRALYDLTPFLPVADIAELRDAASSRPLVAVHVRRGDYVNNPHFFLGDYDDYYGRAFAHFGKEAFYVVVSDDPAWCETWPLLQGFHHRVHRPGAGADPLADLALMSAADHNIITNSSFSWWAAWLGSPEGRQVVMPRRWLPDRTTEQCDMGVPGWVQL